MGISMYLKIGAVVVLLAALYGAKSYYAWSQNEITVLRENVIKMEFALEKSEAAVKSLQKGIRESVLANHAVNKKFQQTRRDNSRLKDLLGKHDLGFLAQKKPGLIQKRVNNGTKNANRCLEIASGSPLTRSEREATKPSEINSSCPRLANPMYREKQ